jgi:hypothetical protein
MGRYLKCTPEERAAMIEAGNRRYAPLASQRSNWIAFLRRYEDERRRVQTHPHRPRAGRRNSRPSATRSPCLAGS